MNRVEFLNGIHGCCILFDTNLNIFLLPDS